MKPILNDYGNPITPFVKDAFHTTVRKAFDWLEKEKAPTGPVLRIQYRTQSSVTIRWLSKEEVIRTNWAKTSMLFNEDQS
jgi:hypothetical protein